MALPNANILSHREILPRTFEHRLGDLPSATRVYSLTLTEPCPHQDLLDTIGIKHGDPHPEFPYLFCLSGRVSEPDNQHAEIEYEYGLPAAAEAPDPGLGSGGGGGGGGLPVGGTVTFYPHPLNQRDVISFSGSAVSTPVTTYYPDPTKNDLGSKWVIRNSAGYPIESVTATVGELKCRISGNRATFDPTSAVDIIGCTNNAVWCGQPAGTWQCTSLSASPASEYVGSYGSVSYWKVEVELTYRRDGWEPILAQQGMFCNRGGKGGQPCLVWDETLQRPVRASQPQPLALDGTQITSTNIEPVSLIYRVHRQIDFSASFGNIQAPGRPVAPTP